MPSDTIRRHLVSLFAAVLLLACSASDTGLGFGRGGLSCPRGTVANCPCPDGSRGVATCGFEARWSACDCAAGTNAPPIDGQALPCDVAAVVQNRCHECHGQQTQFGAPMSLVSWENLHAPATSDPSRSVLDVVAERIRSATDRMPPPTQPELTSSELAAIENWIASGAPPANGNSCTPTGAGGSPNPTGAGGGGNASGGGGGNVSGGGGFGAGGGGGVGGGGPVSGPPDCQDYFEIRAHGQVGENDTTPFPVPKNPADSGNQYMCFYFNPPYAGDAQGLWFSSLLDDTRVLHHWLLYGTDAATQPPGTMAPCSAAEPGAYLLAGWAPGGSDVTMPPGVGLDMPSGPGAGLILEVHYFNSQGFDAVDSSGVRFCTAPENTRPQTAAVHFLGSEGICVPPRAPGEVAGPCQPRTDMGDIHITSVWPHMHQHGRRMQTLIYRVNGTVDVLHDAPFDFNNQITYPKDVVIHPGDRLETRCFYENTTAEAVHFGDRTQDEMCYNFVTAWPAGSLGPDPFTALFNPVSWVQPQRRCMDLTSILQSCNGLADYPTP